jgi:hypothetical protein
VKAVLLEMETALKAGRGHDHTAAKKAPPLYKSTQDARGPRSRISRRQGEQDTTARKAALDALVETEDGKEAWKAIQGAYPADDVEDQERWNVDFVKAVGLLHPDGAIDKLLETFAKAKQSDFAGAAVAALGNYNESKQRERILTEIVKAGKNMVPSRSKTANPSPEASARWGVVSEKIGKALDQLTGDSVGDPRVVQFDEGRRTSGDVQK